MLTTKTDPKNITLAIKSGSTVQSLRYRPGGRQNVDNKALDHGQQARAILAGFIPEYNFDTIKQTGIIRQFTAEAPVMTLVDTCES